MAMVRMAQYFEMMKAVAGSHCSSTVLVPHTPNALSDLFCSAPQYDQLSLPASLARAPLQRGAAS
jgi:hypothetical protein